MKKLIKLFLNLFLWIKAWVILKTSSISFTRTKKTTVRIQQIRTSRTEKRENQRYIDDLTKNMLRKTVQKHKAKA